MVIGRNLFGITIHALDMCESVSTIEAWITDEARSCKYVVTPNVDHIVKLRGDSEFQEAYRDASLVVADGKPVVMASRLLGDALPGTVPGSDLVPSIFERFQRAGKPLGVFLLGAGPGVAAKAALVIQEKWPVVRVNGCYSPPMGFERSDSECAEICVRVARSQADLLVIGLGSPKQEVWVRRHGPSLSVKVALCAGATIDFLAGEKARAPIWMRRFGLEWLHRMASEPRRLGGRYLHDAIVFPGLMYVEWRRRRARMIERV